MSHFIYGHVQAVKLEMHDVKMCQVLNIQISLLFVTGRIASQRQTAGIKFTHRPKITFFAPQGRLVAPIQVKLGRADGHMGPLGCAKFRLNRQRGWECGPQNIKNFHFLVKTPLTDFENFYGLLYA